MAGDLLKTWIDRLRRPPLVATPVAAVDEDDRSKRPVEVPSIAARPITGPYGHVWIGADGRPRFGRTLAGQLFCDGADPAGVGIAADPHGRPQVFASSALGSLQLTDEPTGVIWAQQASACDDDAGAAWFRPKQGTPGVAGWRRSLAPTPPEPVLVGLVAAGQSNAAGYGTLDVETALPPIPGELLMFSDSPAVPAFGVSPAGFSTAPAPAGNFAHLVDAREVALDLPGRALHGESGWVLFGAGYHRHVLRGASRVVVGCVAMPGRHYDQLRKGTNPYAALMAFTKALAAQAAALGFSARLPAVPLDYGEAAAVAGDSAADILADLIEFQRDLEADVRAVTGQSETVILTFPQTPYQWAHGDGWTIADIALGQLEAGNTIDPLVCIGPRYHLTYPDGTHMDGASFVEMGGRHLRALEMLHHHGTKFRPLQVTTAVIRGKRILFTFHLPEGGALALDYNGPVPALTAPDNMAGIRIRQGGRTLPLLRVDLEADDTLVATLVGAPERADGITFGIAAVGGGSCGTARARMSNIRDNSSFTYHGRRLHNWAAHQVGPVTC